MKTLEKRYSNKLIKKAEKEYKKMSRIDIENLKFSVMGGLPAAEIKYTVSKFKKNVEGLR